MTDAPELVEARGSKKPGNASPARGCARYSPTAVDEYLSHGRVSAGDWAEVLVSCYEGWKIDRDARKSSLMVAQDRETVHVGSGEGSVPYCSCGSSKQRFCPRGRAKRGPS